MPYDIDISKQTEALLEINKLVMQGADFPSVMNAVVQGTLVVLPQAHGAIVELVEGEEMVYAAVSGSMTNNLAMRIKRDGSLSGLCVEEERLLYCADSETDARVDRAACRKVGIRSMIVAPLLHRRRSIGVLKVYSDLPEAFSPSDQIVVQFFVTMISAGFGSVVDAQTAEMTQEFINMATHELRTPLTSLKGALELMSGLHKVKLPADVQNLLNIALNGSNRLMLLINDLLMAGKMDAGKLVFAMREEPLGAVLKDAINGMASYRAKISYVLAMETEGVKVKVDRDRFLQVMANLLSNAAKFSPEEGEVTVGTKSAGKKVTIFVKDRGTGMPEAFHSKVFQKFAQARAGHGTGLGLNITKDFVEKMGGRIWFESQEGQGTIFFIEFPAVA